MLKNEFAIYVKDGDVQKVTGVGVAPSINDTPDAAGLLMFAPDKNTLLFPCERTQLVEILNSFVQELLSYEAPQ